MGCMKKVVAFILIIGGLCALRVSVMTGLLIMVIGLVIMFYKGE